ncbi:MAG: prepilin-type N-terminal cleavage/methylation domain-containing protein [Thermoanaerobaculia bacterium]|nr:prepilin-type N-terminal cleavage/methylation domain-containing protein [Thermoanaerobaculia bacterium]
MTQHKRGTGSLHERGYTLIEALVVVAIIGMISVIAVPNFMQFQRAGKVKSSLRNFTADLRAARQRAVTLQNRAMISFGTGTTDGASYTIYTGTRQADGSYVWTEYKRTPNALATKQLEKTVYINSTDFLDTQPTTPDGKFDVIFREDGEVFYDTGETPGFRNIVMQGDPRTPKYRYRVTFSPSGQLKAESF